MKVLAFDCSTARGSVAVVDGGEVVFAEAFDCPRGRGGELFLALERAVKACGRAERVAVGVGPGSYNGLRIAIAAAEGLKLAWGAGLSGVESPRILAVDDAEYLVVNDARSGTFAVAPVRGRRLAGAIELLDAEALQRRVAAVAIPVYTSGKIDVLPEVRSAFPCAQVLASLAGEAEPAVAAIEPLYLKPAHITTPKQLRPARK